MAGLVFASLLAACTCSGNHWLGWMSSAPDRNGDILGSNYEIWGMRADGTSRALFTRDNRFDALPALSADGLRIVLVKLTTTGNEELWTMDFGGGNATRVLDATGSPVRGTHPTFHPDGNRIVFVIPNAWHSDHGDLAILDLATHQVTRITTSGQDTAPDVRHDGQRIAFARNGPNGHRISVANLDGSNVADLAPGRNPAWSPDGRKIAFDDRTSPTGPAQVFVMNANGSGRRQLTNHAGHTEMPAYSPDGCQIAYASDGTLVGEADIWVMDPDGSNPVNLTSDNARDLHPSFNGSP
jgi:TolB protein